MRVAFLNRAYLPDVEATGQYLAELAEDLSLDHDVSVLCGRPNYAELQGRLFPYRCERIGGVDVLRAWGTGWPKKVPLGRMVNQASFFALARLAARRLQRPDVLVSLTDPPFLGLLALALKRRWNAPFVYWCMDIYPDVARAVDMAPGPLAAAFERVQARILAGADVVVALADDMAARLAARGIPEKRIRVIRNWADTRAIHPLRNGNPFRARHGLDGKLVAMYSGNFGYVWDLDAVIDTAAMLRDDDRVVFVLVGGGSTHERIAARVAAEGLGARIRLLPYQEREHLSESLGAADLHLVPMRRGVRGTVVPSKIYGIMAAGVPMAVLAEPDSEAARVVREHDCGWRGDPGDAAGLASIIRNLMADGAELQARGERGRRAAEASYSRERQTGEFRLLLEQVTNGRDAVERSAV